MPVLNGLWIKMVPIILIISLFLLPSSLLPPSSLTKSYFLPPSFHLSHPSAPFNSSLHHESKLTLLIFFHEYRLLDDQIALFNSLLTSSGFNFSSSSSSSPSWPQTDFISISIEHKDLHFFKALPHHFQEIKYVFQDEIIKADALKGNKSFLPLNPPKSSNQGIDPYKALNLDKLSPAPSSHPAPKIAIFDTGISPSFFRHHSSVLSFHDFTTTSNKPVDSNGHGTFMAGLIVSKESTCRGLAPDSKVLIYRVFDDNLESRTEWMLRAFEKALEDDVDIVNFSIGTKKKREEDG